MRTRCSNMRIIPLWVCVVYVLSLICYGPVLLEKNGIVIPNGLLLLRYLYVCIPAIASIFVLICEQNFKASFLKMFSGRITIQSILIWVMCAFLGILVSYCYSLKTGVNVFENLTIPTLLTNGIYLFSTAFVEEIAWRGFLLERLLFKKKICSVILVGMVWTVWHMPMWIIRNSLGVEPIVYLCIWTLLIAIVLGMTYDHCRNLFLIAILHATFNLCYLAPTQYNIVVLAIAILGCVSKFPEMQLRRLFRHFFAANS